MNFNDQIAPKLEKTIKDIQKLIPSEHEPDKYIVMKIYCHLRALHGAGCCVLLQLNNLFKDYTKRSLAGFRDSFQYLLLADLDYEKVADFYNQYLKIRPLQSN